MSRPLPAWVDVKLPPPAALVDARTSTHYAVQIVAAAATLLDAEDDFAHTAMAFDAQHRALVGWPLAVVGGIRVGLRLPDLSLILLSTTADAPSSNSQAESAPGETKPGEILDVYGLGGSSLREGLGWLNNTLKKRGAKVDIRRPEHDLPPHGLGTGLLFDVDQAAQEELSSWFENADRVLQQIADDEAGASPVRCWPHHLDMATLIMFADHDDPDRARTIGVGLSPGDTSFNEPYWYVTPWPYPDDSLTLPVLAGRGHWVLEGFTAGVLEASQLGPDPARAVRDFLDTAVGACKTLHLASAE